MGRGSFAFGIYMVSIYFYKLTVLNGGGGHLPLVSIWSLYILYKLTVSNGGGGSFFL